MMIEKGLTEGMNRFYFLLKISLFFWGLSLLGGLILGVGPSLIVLTETIRDVNWDYKELSFSKMKPLFWKAFKRGNQLLYGSLSLLLFLFLSLYTASQMTGMIFLMIDFLLVVLLVMVSIISFYSYVITSRFEISLKNLIKLSLILFFKEIKASLAITFILILIIVTVIKLPGLAFFVGSGLLAYFINNLGEKLETSLVIR